MRDSLAWPIRPKWHHLETARSYARRQSDTAGIPFNDVERGLTSPSQPYINRVWRDEAAAGRTIEAAAGRAEGHYERLLQFAQPDRDLTYPTRFLCRLCAGGGLVEQIGHDRENWCLRHPGQMVWVGPGTTPETQAVFSFDTQRSRSERRFRRLVSTGRVSPQLHARAWEIVRDSARLSRSERPALAPESLRTVDRASLFTETVAVLEVLSDPSLVDRWRGLPAAILRDQITLVVAPISGGVDVLVERIVLWLRPHRREKKATRVDPLDVPLDIVDAAAIIDTEAAYPRWIQRNPQAVAEWDWSRNDPSRDPWDPAGVSRTAAWVCDEGHTWEAKPSTRGDAVTRCPVCAGQSVWPGHTDLASTHPEIAAEWDQTPESNIGDPDHVRATSGRRVNWVCRHGHRWNASIRSRAVASTNCPYCAGTRPIPGVTDLATLRPDLSADWDHTRNGETTPVLVGPGSAKKAWWIGQCGHHWYAAVRTRNIGAGCPYCANRALLPGFNDLGTTHPDLANQWHPDNQQTPKEVMSGSSYRAAWRCDAGHVWRVAIKSRSRLDTGCPYCTGRAVMSGVNDLATLHPDLASQWDVSPDANSRTPTTTAIGSMYRATWKCREGHTWSARVHSRVAGRGCPYCSGRLAILRKTDLGSLRPDIAAEWRETDLSPEHVTCSSNRTAKWMCPKGHTWEAVIGQRTKGHGCPFCAGKRASPGETDLASLRPDLAAEWDANNAFTPDQFTCGSGHIASWRCAKGHTWRTSITKRTQGRGCPYCSGRRAIPGETDLATLLPHLASEWDPSNTATPDQVARFSRREVLWRCGLGHSWRESVAKRSNGAGCPSCSTRTRHARTRMNA